MTTFIENSSDYLGETVTATEYQPRHQQIGLGGKAARRPSTPDAYRYAGRHQWSAGRHQQGTSGD